MLDELFRLTKLLRRSNWIRHLRHGWCLSDLSIDYVASYAMVETGEVWKAVAHALPKQEVAHELADAMLCLVHIAVMLGISDSDIERAAGEKINQRFGSIDPEQPGLARLLAEELGE